VTAQAVRAILAAANEKLPGINASPSEWAEWISSASGAGLGAALSELAHEQRGYSFAGDVASWIRRYFRRAILPESSSGSGINQGQTEFDTLLHQSLEVATSTSAPAPHGQKRTVHGTTSRGTYFTILHVSDAHFGITDEHGQQSLITEALINAARNHDWTPDLCVFSGDLAFHGAEDEFQRGAEWLSKLIEPWNAKLFVVPGNHDVAREAAYLILRQVCDDERTYSQYREDLMSRLPHLDNFRRWHDHAKSVFGEMLISDWSDPFGCCALVETSASRVQVIGLNTALLSCGNDDLYRLVQDIPTLKHLLAKRFNECGCVVAVGHHPLSWLAKWNRVEVEKLLQQDAGANLYLHGHRHERTATAVATATGQCLATLECGAAYHGSQWSQYFTFYQLDFKNREIATRVFLYSPNAGEWVLDGGHSRVFVGPIPKLQANEPEHTGLLASSELEILELYAYRAVADAETAQRVVETFINSDTFFARAEYSRTSRIKKHDRIVQKVLRRWRDGAVNFRVEDVTDVCGFRYISLYQSSIPLIVDRLLRAIPTDAPPTSSFCREGGVEIEVLTSRHEKDPLSIVSAVRETVARWDNSVQVQERPSATGYSSVRLVMHCRISNRGQAERHFPVEFQIRNILEEAWGQLDHKLRYETGRGAISGEPRLLHLNVLKAQFDS
jgi:ppGpp synthetase/RelA/SpoT-type nucleotidyltranferase/predicted MPP superfamily phosphohydrolase